MVPYDFLQPRFLSAGILYLVATAGPAGLVMYLHHAFRSSRMTKRAVEGATGLTIIGTVFAIGNSLPWLWPSSLNVSSWERMLLWPSAILMIAMAFAPPVFLESFKGSRFSLLWDKWMLERGVFKYVALFVAGIYKVASGGTSNFLFFLLFAASLLFCISVYRSQKHPGLALFDNIYGAAAAIASLGFSVYLYAAYTYPLVSPHIGGGKPLLISLALKPEAQHTIGRIMGREHPECVLHNISLLHENSDFIYVLPKGYYGNNAAIAIPKTELFALSYQGKPLEDTQTCF